MSLSSVLQTAFSGMSAAEMMVDVASDNLANSRTIGFKARRPTFVTQAATTLRSGTGPNAGNGGGNPMQIGLGVRAAGTATDFSQGAIALSANPLDLALEGNGMFIVESPDGGRSYTRSGSFQLNGQGEIVMPSGQRLMGSGVDGNFRIKAGDLQPLTIPLGSTAMNNDGTTAVLQSFSIGQDGRIRGGYSDGQERDLGQIRIATFANPSGIQGMGDNQSQVSPSSGDAIETNPGSGGGATIMGGASELSNADVGQSLVNLSTASNQFQASADVFGTATNLLDELVHLGRATG